MKNFFKENFILILGVSLPVMLIVTFMIAQSFTRLVDPPQYKALFAVQNYYYGNQPYRFTVGEDGLLSIEYKKPKDENQGHYDIRAKIYLYSPMENRTEEFVLDAPEKIEAGDTVTIETPSKLNKLRFNASGISPDGYTFEQHYRRGGNLFTEIFGYNSYRERYALKKGGRYVPIPGTHDFYGQETFIGWAGNESE